MWVNIYLLHLLAVAVPARLLLDRGRVRRSPNLDHVVSVGNAFKEGKVNNGLTPVPEKMANGSWNSTESSQRARYLFPTFQPTLSREKNQSAGLKPEFGRKPPKEQAGALNKNNKDPLEKENNGSQQQGHCECIKNWKNFEHICKLDYHFGMEVVVQNETRHGYFVTLVDIYKARESLKANLVKGQTVHLKFPRSKSGLDLKFARCRCVKLKPNKRYVAFGYKSNETVDDDSSVGGVLYVHQAVHTGTETEIYSRLSNILRRIIKQQCETTPEQAQPTSGLEPLKPKKVGQVTVSKHLPKGHHSSNDKSKGSVHDQLRVSGVLVKEISR